MFFHDIALLLSLSNEFGTENVTSCLIVFSSLPELCSGSSTKKIAIGLHDAIDAFDGLPLIAFGAVRVEQHLRSKTRLFDLSSRMLR